MDYIYIDESGELAKQTNYFVIRSIKVNNPKKIHNLIKKTRHDYRKELSKESEIKGHKTDNYIIKKILRKLNNIDSEINIVYLNKENLYKIPYFYNYNILYDTLASKLAKEIYIKNPTKIFIDKSKNKENEIIDFNLRFCRNLNNFKKHPIKIKHVNSMNFNGLQVADLISWSTFQSLEHSNSEFIDLIKNKNIKKVFKD